MSEDQTDVLMKEIGAKTVPSDEVPLQPFQQPPPMPSNAECAAKLREEYKVYNEQMYGEDPDYLPTDGFFAPGELVTPRKEGYIKDAGTPYIVLESSYGADPVFAADWCGTMRDGFIPNLRIGRWTPFGMVVAWVEAWAFEDYEEDENGE